VVGRRVEGVGRAEEVSAPRRVSPSAAVAVLALAFLGAAVGTRLALAGKSPTSILRRTTPDLSAFDAAFSRAAAESGIDADLLRGLCAAESSGNPRARSGKDAVGLLQLTRVAADEAARSLGVPVPDAEALTDPETNLRLGARYLSGLLRRFDGAEPFALAAYNAGASPVRRWRARAPDVDALSAVLREGYPETKNLVTRSLRFRDDYRAARD
jgi:soluble lytic murein transglycosylase-like protein